MTGEYPTVGGASSPGPGGAPSDPLLGTVLAERYRIERRIGEGGMGAVYLARHVMLEKVVALKILHDEYARRRELVERFLHEAKAASRIRHEHVIDITDFGETSTKNVFFAMEYLEGHELANELDRLGTMPWPRAKKIMLQICAALQAAHEAGVIHRDLKPENIYLIEKFGNSDFVKVLDFGVAKLTEFEDKTRRLTRTGMVFGTPEYMSPEQARGDKPDARVDVYAAGCMLYEMATGQVPFTGDSFMGVLTKHLLDPLPRLSERTNRTDLPPGLQEVIDQALAKHRDERFASMNELAVAIDTLDNVEGISYRAPGALTPERGHASPLGSASGGHPVQSPVVQPASPPARASAEVHAQHPPQSAVPSQAAPAPVALPGVSPAPAAQPAPRVSAPIKAVAAAAAAQAALDAARAGPGGKPIPGAGKPVPLPARAANAPAKPMSGTATLFGTAAPSAVKLPAKPASPPAAVAARSAEPAHPIRVAAPITPAPDDGLPFDDEDYSIRRPNRRGLWIGSAAFGGFVAIALIVFAATHKGSSNAAAAAGTDDTAQTPPAGATPAAAEVKAPPVEPAAPAAAIVTPDAAAVAPFAVTPPAAVAEPTPAATPPPVAPIPAAVAPIPTPVPSSANPSAPAVIPAPPPVAANPVQPAALPAPPVAPPPQPIPAPVQVVKPAPQPVAANRPPVVNEEHKKTKPAHESHHSAASVQPPPPETFPPARALDRAIDLAPGVPAPKQKTPDKPAPDKKPKSDLKDPFAE